MNIAYITLIAAVSVSLILIGHTLIAAFSRGKGSPIGGSGKMYFLDEYKRRKRFRVIVNGRVVQEMSIYQWESLAILNGSDPNGVIEFRIDSDPDSYLTLSNN